MATTQSQVHEEDIGSPREEELMADQIDEYLNDQPVVTEEQDEDDEEEDYDLVFPEKYHSDEAYKNLV